LAFTSNRSGDFELYLLDLENDVLKQLSFSPGFDGEADFSPDGKKLTYVSGQLGYFEIFTMNIDGSHIKQISHGLNHLKSKFYTQQ
jgi:Tol biopolymer transport system component